MAGAVFATVLVTAPLAPVFDPDEGYYPATAAESLDAGSGWDPRLNGAPRWDKPILSYAFIEASFSTFGRTVTASRLPSALHAAFLVLISGIVVARMCTPRAALLVTIVLATTLGVQVFARVAHPEIIVVTAVTTAELLIARWLALSEQRTRLTLASAIGVAIGYGVLGKGPVALVLPVLAAVSSMAVLRSKRTTWTQALRHGALACMVALIVAVPWYALMTSRHGRIFLAQSLWQHNVGRYTGGAFPHPGSIFYFVLPTLLLLFPWTGFLPGALRRTRGHHRTPRDILRVVMTASAVTTFVFYSLSASKLPHYAFAVIPPLAILIGLSLDEVLTEQRQPRAAVWFTGVLFLTLGLALTSAPWLVNRLFSARELFGGALPPALDLVEMVREALWPAAIVLIGCAIAALLMAARNAIWLVATVGGIVPGLMIATAAPLLWYAYPWQKLGNDLRQAQGPVWMVGPRAPSLTFFGRHPVTRLDKSEIEQLMSQDVDGWLVADTRWVSELSTQRLNGHTLVPVSSYGSMTLVRIHRAVGSHAARDPARPR